MGKYCKYKKLISYIRNGLEEQAHQGIILHLNKEGIIKRIGEDNKYKFYQRSCMKPLQLVTLIDLGIDKKLSLTTEEIAVCTASHTGDIIHQELVKSVLNKIDCTEDDLLCPAHLPLSIEERKRLILNKEKETKLHNNCSGKHAAMLAICKEKGFSIKDYKDISHPLTELIINRVCELCETDKKDIIISKDGCGLPVIATTLEQLGKGYLNLFLDPKYKPLKDAFLLHPYIIGGNNRLDTDIIKTSKSTLIAKVGAGGLCVIVNPVKKECIVVKIEDANMEARAFVVINALIQKNWPDDNREFADQINKMYIKKIFSQDKEVLGEILPCFNLN